LKPSKLPAKSLRIGEGLIPKVQEMLGNILAQLGMPGAKLRIEQEVAEDLSESGIDKVKFLFTANKAVN